MGRTSKINKHTLTHTRNRRDGGSYPWQEQASECWQDVGFGQPQRQTNPLTNAEKFNCNFLYAAPLNFSLFHSTAVRGGAQAKGLSTRMFLQWMHERDSITWIHTNSIAEQWSTEMLAYNCRKGSTDCGEKIFQRVYPSRLIVFFFFVFHNQLKWESKITVP